ncbi:hypothetical protein PLICRDRAFT_87929 [Plicaturopsis crispa FD-325 SS-3]|nr:hypothetical protein PLICRDRAFT_87929 [Plicaturopsis crispa FD-325 SS-3]
MRTFTAGQPLLRVGCTLGEGPLYDASDATLHFVDIDEMKVFHFNTVTNDLVLEQYDEPVTCLALRQNGKGLACVAAKGFGIIEDGIIKYLCTPLPDHHARFTRFNDGACDSKGRFFAGTLVSEQHNIPGQLYRYDPADGRCVVVDPGPFTDSNGLGWSPDEKTLYFTDSLVNDILAYDYDDGNVSNRRVLTNALRHGYPDGTFADGLCVDSEGGIWSARFGGSKVVRFTSEGTPDAEIYFPTALNITACCFGGLNEDQLYVTTAHCRAVGGDGSRQSQYPDSGHLFRVDLSGHYKGGQWRHKFTG